MFDAADSCASDSADSYVLVVEGEPELAFDSYDAAVEAFVACTNTYSVFGPSDQTRAVAQQSGTTGYLRKPILSSINADGSYVLLIQVRSPPQV